jgi:hypothetical protein
MNNNDWVIEVIGSKIRRTLLAVLVRGTTDEKTARRAAYEAMFGTPTHPEEVATEDTVNEHTHVLNVVKIDVS